MTNQVPIKHNLMIFLMVRDQRKRPHMQSNAKITLKHYTHSQNFNILLTNDPSSLWVVAHIK
jgi:hypothetical protein